MSYSVLFAPRCGHILSDESGAPATAEPPQRGGGSWVALSTTAKYPHVLRQLCDMASLRRRKSSCYRCLAAGRALQRSPAANAFRYILNPSNVSDDNDFGSFCANQNVVTKANLAQYIFQGRQVPSLPMPAGVHGHTRGTETVRHTNVRCVWKNRTPTIN